MIMFGVIVCLGLLLLSLTLIGILAGRNVARTGSLFGVYQEATPCDVSGRVFVVTGANTGIGKETAMGIGKQSARSSNHIYKCTASMGGKVYLACRRMDAAANAQREIIEKTGNSFIEIIKLDLGDFTSVRSCVEELEKREPNGIHVLINNAAYIANNTETIYGLMKIFVINHLGPFLLTNLLIPLLEKGAKNSKNNSRIVIVASGAADMADLDMNRIDSPQKVAFFAYANSKLENAMFSNALSRNLSQDSPCSVVVNSLNPGWVQTELDRNGKFIIKAISKLLSHLMAKTSKEGAQTSILLATSPQHEFTTGKYFEHCRESTLKNPLVHDNEAQKKLWRECERLLSQIK